MNAFTESPTMWASFQQGHWEAFRFYFDLHHSRIYFYLLRLLGDEARAGEATKQVFLALFRHRAQLEDEDHLLRRLYLNAKVESLLRLKGKRSFLKLVIEIGNYAHKKASIMDHPEVAHNETLLALLEFMRKLPPVGESTGKSKLTTIKA